METTHEMLRMVRKEFSQSKTIMRGWHQARTMNLQENGQDLREILLRTSNDENDNEKHHQELLRHTGRIKSEEVEPTMKRIWKILEEDIWLMITHSYVKLGEEFESNSGKEKSQVRSWKKTCGLGPTQNKHRWNDLKRDCTGWIK